MYFGASGQNPGKGWQRLRLLNKEQSHAITVRTKYSSIFILYHAKPAIPGTSRF